MTEHSSETQLNTNDTCQWEEYERFHSVSEERWQKALSSERHGWQRQMRLRYPLWRLLNPFRTTPFGDDWNDWWAERFDSYTGLPAQVDALFEFGCGPYTNARIILRKVKAARVYLSDPLMPTYLTFRGTWLTREYNRRTVICDSSPLEKSPFSPGAGDIVVLINVLDHVRDGFLALRNALQVVKIGGWFVFGQDLTDPRDRGWNEDELMHPIRFNARQLDSVLGDSFDLMRARRILPKAQGRNPDFHCGTYLLMGRRLQ